MSPYLDIRGMSTNVDTRKCWRASTRCSCCGGPPMRPDARRPPPVASGMAALMSPDLRERGHRTVEVAGIEPGGRGVDLSARGADLRRCPEARRRAGSRWSVLRLRVDAVNGAGA